MHNSWHKKKACCDTRLDPWLKLGNIRIHQSCSSLGLIEETAYKKDWHINISRFGIKKGQHDSMNSCKRERESERRKPSGWREGAWRNENKRKIQAQDQMKLGTMLERWSKQIRSYFLFFFLVFEDQVMVAHIYPPHPPPPLSLSLYLCLCFFWLYMGHDLWEIVWVTGSFWAGITEVCLFDITCLWPEQAVPDSLSPVACNETLTFNNADNVSRKQNPKSEMYLQPQCIEGKN